MNKFDPYETLLQNFSKHKFKLFIEEFLLIPKRHNNVPGAIFGKVNKDDWETSDYAELLLPIINLHVGKFVGATRWIFKLHHFEDGLIKKDSIREFVKKRNIQTAKNLVLDKNKFLSLIDSLRNYSGHPGNRSNLLIYSLTNLITKTTGSRGWDKYISESDAEINSIFFERANELGITIPFNIDGFGMGIGNPNTFFIDENWREIGIEIIKEIEKRPDSINLQFKEGRIEVVCTNKRLFNVYDKSAPKIVLLDQIIDSSLFFYNQEIEEFEDLLNNSKVKEHDLQKFLEAHPKFILNSDYDNFIPQVSLIDEQSKELKPDFFLKPIKQKLWDILEIKLPTVSLISGSKNREGLSNYVRRGVSQLMNYSRFFDNPQNRDRVYRATGIDSFKPRLTLVIGKKLNINEGLWNQIIDQERPFVNIVGFDEILEKAKKCTIKIPT